MTLRRQTGARATALATVIAMTTRLKVPDIAGSAIRSGLKPAGQTGPVCVAAHGRTMRLDHTCLAGLAATGAAHAGHIGVQPRLELEGVELLPRAAQSIMNACSAAPQFGQASALVRHRTSEVDALTRGLEFKLGHLPRIHHTKLRGSPQSRS